MGSGSYSVSNSVARESSYRGVSTDTLFHMTQEKAVSRENKMNPKNTLRECRDSEEHPTTIPIIIALDETGSMGYIPESFCREDMTKMMGKLYSKGLSESQVLFMGIGDHTCDSMPLQVGQFEADDELMDKWLRDVWLEGRGGGNDGESYFLAWKYAAENTSIDAFEKRGKKGFLFTIGDEKNLKYISEEDQAYLYGDDTNKETTSSFEFYRRASEMYDIYHLHIKQTGSGRRKEVIDEWRENLGDNLIEVEDYKEIPNIIADIVAKGSTDTTSLTTSEVENIVNTVEIKAEDEVDGEISDLAQDIINW